VAANHPLTLAFILESGDRVLILEGVAAAVTEAGRLQAFLDAYNPKHDWDAAATDEGVTDSAGAVGPAYRVRPRVAFGWDVDMRAPTRWSFTDSTTSLTPSAWIPFRFPTLGGISSPRWRGPTLLQGRTHHSAQTRSSEIAANVERHSKPLNIAGPPLEQPC
jgi:hypothetical protein